MSDTKALYDVVEKALANWGNGEAQDALEALMGRLRDVEKEREEDQGVIRVWRGRCGRAEADNAALLAAISTYHEAWKTGRDGVPFAALLRTAHKPHPGSALLEELEGLKKQVEFLRGREQHIAKVLDVADSGQYRNDWDGAVERLKAAAHNAALEEAAKVASLKSAFVYEDTPDAIAARIRARKT